MNNGRDRQTFVFEKDGNMICCHLLDFVNLQESPAGFGSTPLHALQDLLRLCDEGRRLYRDMNAGAKSDLNQEMDYLVTPSEL